MPEPPADPKADNLAQNCCNDSGSDQRPNIDPVCSGSEKRTWPCPIPAAVVVAPATVTAPATERNKRKRLPDRFAEDEQERSEAAINCVRRALLAIADEVIE
jgi:hypothetical protein